MPGILRVSPAGTAELRPGPVLLPALGVLGGRVPAKGLAHRERRTQVVPVEIAENRNGPVTRPASGGAGIAWVKAHAPRVAKTTMIAETAARERELVVHPATGVVGATVLDKAFAVLETTTSAAPVGIAVSRRGSALRTALGVLGLVKGRDNVFLVKHNPVDGAGRKHAAVVVAGRTATTAHQTPLNQMTPIKKPTSKVWCLTQTRLLPSTCIRRCAKTTKTGFIGR